MTDKIHIAALEDLRAGVQMDRHNLPDSDAKLAALDAALAVLRAAGEPSDEDIIDAMQPLLDEADGGYICAYRTGRNYVAAAGRALLSRYAALRASTEDCANGQ